MKGAQLVSPNAVSAAMAAWMMAFTMSTHVIFLGSFVWFIVVKIKSYE